MADSPTDREHSVTSLHIPVLYGMVDTIQEGWLCNLYPDSIKIVGKRSYAPKTLLRLLIRYEKYPISLRGLVRWSDDTTLGVDIFEPPQKYLEFIGAIFDDLNMHRREPRYGSDLWVTFKTPDKLIEASSGNISKGGMFIKMDDPPELGAHCDLQFLLADVSRTVRVVAKVVHVARPIKETEDSKTFVPGVGVQFVSFLDKDEDVLKNYIGMLEKEVQAAEL